MIQKLIILITFSILLIGCDKDEIVTTELKGIFKVDTLSYIIDEAVAPNDSLWHYVECSLTYHFENYKGTLNSIVFIIADSIGVGINIDYAYPDSVNKMLSWKEKFWLQKRLNNNDSVKIYCGMSGAFWEEINNIYQFVDTFEWQNQNIIFHNK